MRISVVVPVLNEKSNVRPLYERLVSVFAEMGGELELIYIDDGSRDGTRAAVTALHREDPRVKLISFSRNFGHQAALTAGMDHATGDALVIMDADLQHPPEKIPELVRRWQEGFDVVHTVREANASAGPLKRLTSDLFYRIFRFLSGVRLPMHAADFRLLDRKVVDAFSEIRERTRFLRGLTAWVGYRSTAVHYRAGVRQSGETKYSTRKMLRLAVHGILSFSTVPLRMAIYVGFVLATGGFVYGAFAVRAWLAGAVVPGWTSTFILLALVGGIQLVVVGLLGLYVGRIYEELKKRPIYLVAESAGVEGLPVPDRRRGDIEASRPSSARESGL